MAKKNDAEARLEDVKKALSDWQEHLLEHCPSDPPNGKTDRDCRRLVMTLSEEVDDLLMKHFS